MDSRTIDKLKHVSNTEVIRRLLVKYFMDKGFVESFDRQIYPSVMQDLPYVIPVLSNKLEIVPFAEDIDPGTGKARLGWNLFVLGNQRMYLGETFHNNLRDLARQIHGGLIMPPNDSAPSALKQTTPRRIVTFVTRVLGDHNAGYVDLSPSPIPPQPPGTYGSHQAAGMSQQFFSRSGT